MLGVEEASKRCLNELNLEFYRRWFGATQILKRYRVCLGGVSCPDIELDVIANYVRRPVALAFVGERSHLGRKITDRWSRCWRHNPVRIEGFGGDGLRGVKFLWSTQASHAKPFQGGLSRVVPASLTFPKDLLAYPVNAPPHPVFFPFILLRQLCLTLSRGECVGDPCQVFLGNEGRARHAAAYDRIMAFGVGLLRISRN